MNQHQLDELTGDRVEFAIHTGDPGPDCTDNLAFGDGLRQPYSFAEGGSVGFRIPVMPLEQVRVSLPRRWWQIRTRYRSREVVPMAHVKALTMWSNGQAIMRLSLPEREYWLKSGDVLIVTPTFSVS
ncbi:hypothetical protein [Nocardia sp. NPDC060249]|uniref:hypothetical protein n=1 Tax=Nocardia sp. NPDC060249 TaxID=3347082 RepID=UPI0036640E18